MKILQKLGFKREEKPSDEPPVNLPVNFRRPPTLHEQIKQILHSAEIRREFLAKGIETFEEANDFDIPGEDMTSPYEEHFIGQHDREAAMESQNYETQGRDRVRRKKFFSKKKPDPTPPVERRVSEADEKKSKDEK